MLFIGFQIEVDRGTEFKSMFCLTILQAASPPQATASNAANPVTTFTAIVGAVFGVAGFALAVLNYLRDNPRVLIWFKGGMIGLNRPNGEWATLWVCNSGRRSLHIVSIGFRLPLYARYHHMISRRRKRITHLLWTGTHLAPISLPWRHPAIIQS